MSLKHEFHHSCGMVVLRLYDDNAGDVGACPFVDERLPYLFAQAAEAIEERSGAEEALRWLRKAQLACDGK